MDFKASSFVPNIWHLNMALAQWAHITEWKMAKSVIRSLSWTTLWDLFIPENSVSYNHLNVVFFWFLLQFLTWVNKGKAFWSWSSGTMFLMFSQAQGFTRANLTLQDPECKASVNATHYMLETPLTGCQTTKFPASGLSTLYLNLVSTCLLFLTKKTIFPWHSFFKLPLPTTLLVFKHFR